MNLKDLGWSESFEQHFRAFARLGYVPGRATREEKLGYVVYGIDGERYATLAGTLRHDAASRRDLPAVGDWVAMQTRANDRGAVIHAVLPRRSAFVRQSAGRRSDDQVVAANVDLVFLLCGLDGDFNLRRLERYLTLAHAGGASPVVLLNKADLCADVDARLREVEAVSPATPVHAISALAPQDQLDVVTSHLRPGATVALLGSSGVGKSTLINSLLGREQQKTLAVRNGDGRGRHTTTRRELFVLPGGGLVIDTPGMRELQLPAAAGDLSGSFSDIEQLAACCRFRDCRHDQEPGCAIRAAVQRSELDPARLASFHKLGREMDHAAARDDPRAQRERRDRWKRIHKQAQKRMKARRRW